MIAAGTRPVGRRKPLLAERPDAFGALKPLGLPLRPLDGRSFAGCAPSRAFADAGGVPQAAVRLATSCSTWGWGSGVAGLAQISAIDSIDRYRR